MTTIRPTRYKMTSRDGTIFVRRPHGDVIHPTRYKELGYVNDGPRLWRFVDTSPDGFRPDRPARVGWQYASRAELLADLERYYRANWATA